MYRLEDVVGIEELVGSGVFTICEPDTMKATSLKAAFMIWVMSEPVDPEEFHALALHRPQAPHVDMEDSKDFRIPVLLRTDSA